MNPAPRLLTICLVLSVAASAAGAEKPAPPVAATAAIDPDLYGDAVLREGRRAQYPASVKDGVGARVTVRFIVDATGRVTQTRVLDSTDSRFDAEALAAVKTWVFSPAIERGRETASCLEATLRFALEDAPDRKHQGGQSLREDEWPVPSARTPAEGQAKPPVPTPDLLKERMTSALVQFTFTVDPEGRAHAKKILALSHADLALPAVAALESWAFTPAKQGDLPLAAELGGDVSFSSFGTGPGMRWRRTASPIPRAGRRNRRPTSSSSPSRSGRSMRCCGRRRDRPRWSSP